ncbi:beta strand repeat-containing protein [Mucilaginibacter sp.]|jgi:hypothetical protein|uniref:beta strand repeat-containing protein n=1 Tax=Mucilaginibacter sp. TaxID=1882438 RepID=UPI0035617CD1
MRKLLFIFLLFPFVVNAQITPASMDSIPNPPTGASYTPSFRAFSYGGYDFVQYRLGTSSKWYTFSVDKNTRAGYGGLNKDNFYTGYNNFQDVGMRTLALSSYGVSLIPGDIVAGNLAVASSNMGPFIGTSAYRDSEPTFRWGERAGGGAYVVQKWNGSGYVDILVAGVGDSTCVTKPQLDNAIDSLSSLKFNINSNNVSIGNNIFITPDSLNAIQITNGALQIEHQNATGIGQASSKISFEQGGVNIQSSGTGGSDINSLFIDSLSAKVLTSNGNGLVYDSYVNSFPFNPADSSFVTKKWVEDRSPDSTTIAGTYFRLFGDNLAVGDNNLLTSDFSGGLLMNNTSLTLQRTSSDGLKSASTRITGTGAIIQYNNNVTSSYNALSADTLGVRVITNDGRGIYYSSSNGTHLFNPTDSSLVTKDYVDAAIISGSAGFVPNTRQILNGYGIQGGGTLAADRTLSIDTTVIPSKTFLNSTYIKNTTTQQSGYNFNISGVGQVGNFGIGVAPGSRPLSIGKSLTDSGLIRLQNISSSGYTSFDYYDNAGLLQNATGYGNTGVAMAALQGVNYHTSFQNAPYTWLFGSAVEKMRLNTTGLGINTTSPSHSITIGSTGTGVAAYNTADQTTNFERVRDFWSTNILTRQTEAGGTGVIRNQAFVSGGTNFSLGSQLGATAQSVFYFNRAGTAALNLLEISHLDAVASSGNQNILLLGSKISQTGSAGYTGIKISTWENTLGSGSKYFLDLGTNTALGGSGTHTRKFSIDNTGVLMAAGGSFVASPTAPTPTVGDNTTKLATMAALQASITGLIIGTPTILAGAGAGTAPTVSVTTNGKGLQVTVTTGTLPTGTNATIATVTLANALSYTPYPVFAPANGATALLNGASMVYMTSTGTANVTITSGTTALVAATTYVFNITL